MNLGWRLLFLLILIAGPTSVAAGDGRGWHVSPHGGVVVQNEKGVDSRVGFGGRFGYHFSPRWSSGLYILHSQVENTAGPLSFKTGDSFVMVDMEYAFTEFLRGVRMGLQAGMVNRTLKGLPGITNDGVDMSALGFGGDIGYRYRFQSGFAIGADVGFLSAGSASKTITSDNTPLTYSLSSTTFLNFLLSLAYNF